MSVGDLVVQLAFEMLQFDNFVRTEQYQGVAANINSTASSLFGNVLRIPGGSARDLINSFRDIGACLAELIGYLSAHSINGAAVSSHLQILNYSSVMGNTSGTGYIYSLGSILPDPLYYPLSKYISVTSGRSARPMSLLPDREAFPQVQPFVQGTTRMIPDGNDVLLVHAGPLVVNASNIVIVDASLQNKILSIRRFTEGDLLIGD